MKKLLILLKVTLLTGFLSAQSSLSEITNARRVQDFIRLEIKNDLQIEYYFKNTKGMALGPKTLDTLTRIQSKDDEFRIDVNFINPLQYRISSTSDLIENELFKASNNYLTTVTDLFVTVNGTNVSGNSEIHFLLENKIKTNKKRSQTCPNKDTVNITDPQLAEVLFLLTSDNNKRLLLYNNCKLSDFVIALDNIKFNSKKDFINKEIYQMFEDLEGINNVGEISTTLKVNENKKKSVLKALDALEESISISKTERTKAFVNNNDRIFTETLKFKLDLFHKEVEEYVKEMRLILKKDGKFELIEKLFKEISDAKISDQNAFNLTKQLSLKTDKFVQFKLKVEKLNFDKAKKNLKVEKTKNYTINVYRYRMFIPIVTTGIYYTNVSFNQFGTDENTTGESIVTKTESELNELASLTHLNLYYNGDTDIKWFGQLGVGPSKEKPLIGLGVGVELFESFNISMGGVWTWQRNLNELKEGDIVTGTSVIEDDIIYQFNTTPRFYIGVNINLTKKKNK